MMADDGEQLGLAAAVTVAWLANPQTRAGADDVAAMLSAVSATLRALGDAKPVGAGSHEAMAEHVPAVTARRSLASPDHIISMIDGKPYRALARHVRAHGLSPDEYRQRYGLKPDYPMVAPSYSASRSSAAKQHNFGRPLAAEPDLELAVVKPTERAEPVAPASARSGAAGPAEVDPARPETGTAPAGHAPAGSAPATTPAKRRRLSISGARKAGQAHPDTDGNEIMSATPTTGS